MTKESYPASTPERPEALQNPDMEPNDPLLFLVATRLIRELARTGNPVDMEIFWNSNHSPAALIQDKHAFLWGAVEEVEGLTEPRKKGPYSFTMQVPPGHGHGWASRGLWTPPNLTGYPPQYEGSTTETYSTTFITTNEGGLGETGCLSRIEEIVEVLSSNDSSLSGQVHTDFNFWSNGVATVYIQPFISVYRGEGEDEEFTEINLPPVCRQLSNEELAQLIDALRTAIPDIDN